ncbi:MAG: ABC transporter substrate-binding protein, partial [Anaerolineae bacterium]
LAIACAPVAAPPPAPAEEEAAPSGPIKIGLLAPTSSVAASSAQDMIDGWNLWWEQNGTQVAGREVQTSIEDSAGNPDTALNKARLLVDQRGVHMLVGTLFASEGYAVATLTEETGVPTFYPIAASDDLTQRQPVPALIRVAGWTSSQPHHPFGEWVAKTQGCKRVYTIGSDYAFGHEVVGGFVNTFTDNGGEVVDQAWNPIGETDFSSYLATIKSANPDCVFNLQVGATAIRFIKAWDEFGLKGEIPLFLGEVPADQSILRGIDPPELAVGLLSVGHYAEGRDSPATQDFIKAYDERYGNLPSYYSVALYTAAQWITRAIEAVDGNVEDREAFLEAVRNVEFADTPMGPLKLDKYDNPVFNVYIRRVELRDDGRLWNVVVDTYPAVSQFYKYNPGGFLEQPVYTREYQGVDWP